MEHRRMMDAYGRRKELCDQLDKAGVAETIAKGDDQFREHWADSRGMGDVSPGTG